MQHSETSRQRLRLRSLQELSAIMLAFHDADTDTDTDTDLPNTATILRPREEIACVGRKIVAVFGESVSVSVSASWNANLIELGKQLQECIVSTRDINTSQNLLVRTDFFAQAYDNATNDGRTDGRRECLMKKCS